MVISSAQGRAAVIGYVAPLGETSIARQRAIVRTWARAHRTAIVEWHIEADAERRLDERPALLEALTALKTHSACTLLVASPECVAVGPAHRAVVEQLAVHVGARVVYASDSTGTLDAGNFADALVSHERMLLRLRMNTARELKQARGVWWGRCPWGYRFSADGMRLEPYEPEQVCIAVIRHARASGFKLREIADILRDAGIVGRTGKPLSITRIFEILDQSGDTKRGPRTR